MPLYVTPVVEKYLTSNIYKIPNKKGYASYVDKKFVSTSKKILEKKNMTIVDFLNLPDKDNMERIVKGDAFIGSFKGAFGSVGSFAEYKAVCVFAQAYDGLDEVLCLKHPGNNNIGIVTWGKEKVNNVEHNDMLYNADSADMYIKGCKSMDSIKFSVAPSPLLK